MLPTRRRISTKVFVIQGVWSVKENGSFIVEGVLENEAWKAYLGSVGDAELLHGSKVMSKRQGLK